MDSIQSCCTEGGLSPEHQGLCPNGSHLLYILSLGPPCGLMNHSLLFIPSVGIDAHVSPLNRFDSSFPHRLRNKLVLSFTRQHFKRRVQLLIWTACRSLLPEAN